ncbi:hypothetical protein EXE53_23030, partial [Halorubrum sp. SD626R]|uniref:CARDB domain-containing protein n=1 Tax=Halorubrum sp. SD626R TaxID=1419722 RepID=UPI0010F91259
MDGQRIAAVLFAVLMVTSMVAVPGAVTAQDDERDSAEPASYYGTVEIDGETAGSDATVSAVVDGEVVDTLSVNETGWYGGPDTFVENLVVDAADAENDTTVEFRVNGEPVTRTDPSSVEYSPGDVQRVDLRAGGLDPIYEFAVEDADESVTRGDDAELTVSVENTGSAGADELTVTAAGEDDPRASRTLNLDTNETTTEVLSVPTREDDGDQITLTVATDEESAERTVDLRDPSNFSVALDIDAPEGEGEQYDPTEDGLNGTVTVDNAGETADEQNVSVSFGDETLVNRAVELDGGTNTEIEFNRTLAAADAGETTVTATTDDDIATRTVSVLRPGTLEIDVIEDESTLSPVAGQNVSVVAEITNVGEADVTDRAVNLTNVTADASDEVASEEFTLAPSESQDFDPSVETIDDDAGSDRTYEIASGDDAETVDVTVENRDAFLDVTIDDLNESSVEEPTTGETEPVQVNATVENLGTQDASGDVSFTANGEEFANRTFDDSDGTQRYNVTYPVELGDAPEVTIGAAAERDGTGELDTTDETPLTVTPQAQFTVSIDEAANKTDLSNESGEFAPTVSVENVGDQPASGNVTVFFNGTAQDTIEFDPNSLPTVVQPNDGFSINTSGLNSGQSYLLEAEVANDATGETDADTDRVSIGEPANFTVSDVSAPSSADQGEEISIDATVENTGGVDAEKPVTVAVGGTTLQTTDLNLSADESSELTVDYTPTSADAGETPEVTVATPDDEATDSVDVREDAEFAADLTVDETAIAGDTVTAGVTVTNDGGDAGNTTDVRLLADGEEIDSTSVELAAGEQTTERFEVPAETAGDLEVQGVTDDDVAEATVDVGEPGELDLSVRSVTDPVTADENVTVTVAAENIGDGDLEDRRVRLSVDGSLANTTTADIAGGDTETVELSSELGRSVPDDETVTADVAVVTPEDRVDREVTVRSEPDDAY